MERRSYAPALLPTPRIMTFVGLQSISPTFLKFFYWAESRLHMSRHGTAERCAIQLRHLLQLLVQSPCLPRNKEENASLKSSGQDNSVVTPVKLTTAVDRRRTSTLELKSWG